MPSLEALMLIICRLEVSWYPLAVFSPRQLP